MIKVKNLSKQHGKLKVLDKVSFEIKKGEIFGIIGPNGAGKSTLISIMSTIMRPTGGDILIDEHSIISEPMYARKRIGYVPQETALYPTLTVLDNLRFWAGISCSGGKKTAEQRIKDIISRVGLYEKMNVKVSHLSGGMVRKLNIAAALVHDPDIIIMDEPMVGVDIQSKRGLLNLIMEMSKEGKTIVYTSHSSEEIEILCHRILLLNTGKALFEGTLQEASLKAADGGVTPMLNGQRISLDDILCCLGRWESV